MKKKYKPIALKTHPVLSTLPLKFHIEWNIIGDLLTDIPTIPTILPPPHGHYTKKRCNKPTTYILQAFSGPLNTISYTTSKQRICLGQL